MFLDWFRKLFSRGKESPSSISKMPSLEELRDELFGNHQRVDFIPGEKVIFYFPNKDIATGLRPRRGWVIETVTYTGEIYQCPDTGRYFKIFPDGEYYLDGRGFVVPPHPLWRRVLHKGRYVMKYDIEFGLLKEG